MKKTCLYLVSCLIVIPLIYGYGKAFAEEPGNVCSIQLENDFFGGGSDRHFTHGSRVTCLTEPIGWITDAAGNIPWFDTGQVMQKNGPDLQARASISLGHNMYTPEDITKRRLIKEDRPYAGWLSVGFGLVANQGSKRYDKLELNIGVVGPLSYAAEVQKGWHTSFGLRKPEGWKNQLNNELALNIFYEQARRLYKNSVFGLRYDVIPHIGGGLGNVLIYAGTGVTVRIGSDLKDDFGPPRIRPSLPGGDYFRGKIGFNWYLFAGVEGRAVLHNIFLDGNTFSNSHSVKREVWVGDLQAGAAMQLHNIRISYTQIYRTKEYKGQDRPDKFGSVSISYQF